MNSSPLLAAHPFPLIRGGGLFVLFVGLSILIGALAPRRRWAWFIAGTIAASVVATLTARAFNGKPSAFQLECLIAAVFTEVIVLGWLGNRLRGAPERQRVLSILLVVGAHFFLMGPAFGPLIVLLGFMTVVNAVAGLYTTVAPWPVFWAVDGVLKTAIGGAMFLYAPRIGW